jgi:hypothetical protein
MGQAKRRGTLEDRIKQAQSGTMAYEVEDHTWGQSVTGDIEAYRADAEQDRKRHLDRIWANAQQQLANVDLAIAGGRKLWTGLEKSYHGHKMWPILYDVSQTGLGKAIAKRNGQGVPVLMLQIWKGYANVMIGVTQAQLDDAGRNWEGKDLLAKTDLLNRGISALRLMNDAFINTVLLDQIYHKASKAQGIDAGTLLQIWD